MVEAMPDIDGRSPWEVLVRMDQKLDTALVKLADHENRLRNSATNVEVLELRAEVKALSLEQTRLANTAVTTKGLVASAATTVTLCLGLITLLNHLIK